MERVVVPKGSVLTEPSERWSTQDASELYDVASWGKGYFSVDEVGHVRVHPEKDPLRSIDLKQLIGMLRREGYSVNDSICARTERAI